MKKGIKLKVVCSILTLCMVLSSQPKIFAEEVDTKEEAIKAYENILANNPYEDYDGGFTAKTFNVMDITGDDIPELIIDEEAPQIFTFKDGQVIWLYNSWVRCNMYYSEKTKNLMYYYSWDGVKNYTIYKYDDSSKALTELKNLGYKNKNYYISKDGKNTKITKSSFTKYMSKYMPGKTKLTTPYENTEENRSLYLK